MEEVIKNEIINKYLHGTSNKELSQKYEVHRCTIQRLLKVNNIPLHNCRFKHLDETMFESIDTQEKSYILGLIYSDGNLTGHQIEVSLIYTDKQILEDISMYVYNKIYLGYRNGKTMLETNKLGNNYISKPQHRFYISSVKVANSLRSIGLCENKSLIIRFPEILKNSEELTRHFIRGFYDGDGGLHIHRIEGKDSVKITTNYEMCYDIKVEIEKYLKINVCVVSRTKNVGAIQITGARQIKIFLDWIYVNSTLKLNRKYDLYVNKYQNYSRSFGLPVKRIDCDGNEKCYSNMLEGAKDSNLKYGVDISRVCKGKRKSAGGFKWEFL